jgi:hypothetical protein
VGDGDGTMRSRHTEEERRRARAGEEEVETRLREWTHVTKRWIVVRNKGTTLTELYCNIYIYIYIYIIVVCQYIDVQKASTKTNVIHRLE